MDDVNDRDAIRYSLADLEGFCQLAAGAAMSAVLPEEPAREAIVALAGDPAIMAASDEAELRRRYAVMRERLMDAANHATSEGIAK